MAIPVTYSIAVTFASYQHEYSCFVGVKIDLVVALDHLLDEKRRRG